MRNLKWNRLVNLSHPTSPTFTSINGPTNCSRQMTNTLQNATNSAAHCFALKFRPALCSAGLTWPYSANVEQVYSGACAYLHWTIVEIDRRSALTHTALSFTDDWRNSGGISLTIHTHRQQGALMSDTRKKWQKHQNRQDKEPSP